MSAKRVILGDELSAPAWQRLRGQQVRGELPGDQEAGGIPLTDNLPTPAWFGLREAQVGGVDLADHAAPMRAVVAQRTPTPPQGPLKGRPGVAAIVAGALNTIASGPNTSARIDTSKVKGTLSRGVGRDLTARAKVLGADVGATGVLDPPTGRAEIGLSGIVGEKIGLPSRVRIYTTPTGELDIDLAGPVKLGPIVVRRKGTYVIGQEDPPRRKK